MGNFLTVLWRMSWQASIIILVIVALRKIYELLHIEKKYVMLLWIIPFFCLICPIKISVPYGFWQDSVVELTYDQKDIVVQLGDSYSGDKADTLNGNENIKFEVVAPDSQTGNNTLSDYKLTIDYKFLITNILGLLWVFGVLALLIWNIISYWKLKNKLICSNKVDDNVYKGDEVESPIVFGFFRPNIYMPLSLPEEYEKYVLAHERTHIRRFDVVFKLIVYSISCIHWFNPIVWLAFYLFNKDMEMSCDEETVRTLGCEEKDEYAKAILGVAAKKNFKAKVIFAAPIAFEEGNVKKRIVNIVRYKKTVTVLSICAVALCIILAGVFVTKDKTIVEGKVVDTQDDINREAFNAYTEFINQVEAAILDDFKSVSADELGISKAFEDGIDLNSFRIGYQIYDTNADGVLDLLFVAEDRYSGIRLLFDNYTYEKGEIFHRNSSTVGIVTSGGEFFKFAVPQEPKATEVPVTETPSTEMPSTEEPDVVYTETIVDSQIVDTGSQEVAEAFDAYKEVLKNESTLIDVADKRRILLKDLNESFSGGVFDLSSIAIIDLDSDGVPEVLVAHQNIPETDGSVVSSSENILDIGYYILRYNNRKVYCYYRSSNAFDDIKIDGTFSVSGGDLNHGVCKLYFDGNVAVVDNIDYVESYYDEYPLNHTNYYVDNISTSEEAFNERMAYQAAKPGVTWYAYSEENIDKCFNLISSEEKQRNIAYGKALWEAYQKGVMPDGRELGLYGSNVSENSFAIVDVDNDGNDELIIRWNAQGLAMVSCSESVYDYKDKVIHKELSGYPSIRYYDNGIAIKDWSHNQSRGSIIWPYTLSSYDKENDTYKDAISVESWSKSWNASELFPDDIDKDGDGHVYDIMRNGNQYDRDNLVDGAEYEQWLNSYLNGAEEITIPYQPLTEENIESLGAPRTYVEPIIYKG